MSPSRNDARSTTRKEREVPFIEQVTDESATGEARELLDAERAPGGYVCTLAATGVQPDSVLRELEPELRDALAFERAIA
jgi:hypothetical protein